MYLWMPARSADQSPSTHAPIDRPFGRMRWTIDVCAWRLTPQMHTYSSISTNPMGRSTHRTLSNPIYFPPPPRPPGRRRGCPWRRPTGRRPPRGSGAGARRPRPCRRRSRRSSPTSRSPPSCPTGALLGGLVSWLGMDVGVGACWGYVCINFVFVWGSSRSPPSCPTGEFWWCFWCWLGGLMAGTDEGLVQLRLGLTQHTHA